MADQDNTYMTKLRTTRRKVKLTAQDHDRVIVADARRALEKRSDELDRILESVRGVIKRRKAILSAADDELRELYDAKITEKLILCDVFVDARNGGTIKIVRQDNGELLGDPRPLSKEEREVFASTKSSPDMFGDAEVNEELAAKLKLTEYISDDEPVDPQRSVSDALDASALPDDLKEALLDLDSEDEASAKGALSDAKKAKGKNEKKGRKKEVVSAAPAETPSSSGASSVETATVEETPEPGPDEAEPDPDPPRMPRPPRAVQPDDDEDDVEEDGVGDGEEQPDADEGSDDGEFEFVEDEAPPPEDDAPLGGDDDIPDFGPLPGDEEVAAEAANDAAPAAEAVDVEADSPVEPVEDSASPVETSGDTGDAVDTDLVVPSKASTKKRARKASVAEGSSEGGAVVPTHTLTLENHFGLSPKVAPVFVKCIGDAVQLTPVFADRAVEIVSSPKANGGKQTPFSPKWAAALIPVLDHLSNEKRIRRRVVGKSVVYWHESYDSRIDDVIAGYQKDGGLAFAESLKTK